LVEDAGIDILSALAAIAGDRIARGQDAHFATGSGTGQPVGISSATVGKTTATNATVTLAEWEAFFFSLRPAYRTNASVVMHSATYQEALSLLDSSNRPVFDREVGTMFGFRVVCDDNMAQIGANAVVAVAGRFDRGYLLRDVVPTTAVVLKERFCDVLCSAVVAAQRTDANLTDLAALRALKMHS
jgi:HK97 family phage major capsid protein